MSDPFRAGQVYIAPGQRLAPTLLCPLCKGEYLHHLGVTSFDRDEDAASLTKTIVRKGRVFGETVESATSDNPSNRRDGLVILFSCEYCSNKVINLTIAQHKGSTEINWEIQDEQVSDDPSLLKLVSTT